MSLFIVWSNLAVGEIIYKFSADSRSRILYAGFSRIFIHEYVFPPLLFAMLKRLNGNGNNPSSLSPFKLSLIE